MYPSFPVDEQRFALDLDFSPLIVVWVDANAKMG
jgi:hypothetical protein